MNMDFLNVKIYEFETNGTKMPAMNEEEKKNSDYNQDQITICGEVTSRLSWVPIRILAIVTGLVLIRALITLVVRYLLGFKRKATASLREGSIVINTDWLLRGKVIRQVSLYAPIGELGAVQFEKRQRYAYLVIGFGALTAGVWMGMQFVVDGLRAGYPYLTLIGAVVVMAGVGIDLLLYFLIPSGNGRTRLSLMMGRTKYRLGGVDSKSAARFVDEARRAWTSREYLDK